MNKVIVKEVRNKDDLRQFIYLPEKIHTDNNKWLHPLYMDEWKFFSPEKNSLFKHNITGLFLATKDERPVGRIMTIIPLQYNRKYGLKNGRFAFFECFNDKEVFDALIYTAEQWVKKHECNMIVGPFAFSDKEPQGFLTKGFNDETMIVTNCSEEFMVKFIQQNQYLPHIELYQYELVLNSSLVERYKPFSERVQRNNQIVVHEFSKTKQVRPFIKPVFELINKTYKDIYGFTPLTETEAQEFSNRFLPLLNPRLIKVICGKDGEVLAFVVAMADLSIGIRKARGRLFPTGWYHILRAGKSSKRLVLLLGAISEKVRNKGLDAVLAEKLLGDAVNLGFTKVDSHLIMKDNYKMRREIERLEGHRRYKEYCIYKKDLK